jgi:hypothetical protein
MRLFDRVVELTVGNTTITGLDIAFEIEKDESTEPNPCHIDIFNLSPENRAILSKYDRVPVVLKAGFKEQIGVIFKGDMVRCNHVKEKASWKTTLACGDGAMAIATKRTNKSYAKGTSVKTVVEDLAKQMGMDPGHALSQLTEMNTALSRSYMISGNPMAEVTRLLSNENILTSVQNGVLQIRKRDQPLQKEALLLNAETGLIASPEISFKKKVIIKALLMPGLNPGRILQIDSAMFKGLVTIEKVRFMGATFGNDWEAEMDCVALK